MSSVHCNDRPTETRPSLAGPSRSSTPTVGSDPRKQSLIDNPHRLDTEGHFRTDVSYLPDLHAYLDDLLRNRERVLAAAGVDQWARAAAAPPEQEITRIRQLITRIENGLGDLTDAEREQVSQAVAIVRRHRTVSLGMPRLRQALPAVRPERTA
jgi:hypothetical protein